MLQVLPVDRIPDMPDNMIASPAHATCEICDAPATLHLDDSTTNTDHLFCSEHSPALAVGERSPQWTIRHWRMAPGNHLSLGLAAPKDSQEHQRLYLDLCESGLLGGDGACRYYLSMITRIDQFVLWENEFSSNMREFVASKTCPAASVFCQTLNSIRSLATFMRRAYENSQGRGADRRVTKAEKALELLLRHPEWSDEEIAAQVPTTLKQLRRWTDYAGLRATCQRETWRHLPL
jgi:hypothetical protein